MSPRTGRPTNEPKRYQIMVRLDEHTNRILEAYCKQEKVTKAEAMRIGAKKLEQDVKQK